MDDEKNVISKNCIYGNGMEEVCPRCGSSNTKFCYYNNYSLTQPRYFCKACRRYWTKGGSLRNVPVGGGCRKTRRHKSTRPASSTIYRVESSSNEPASTTPNIDIAAVYANFLNQAETTSHLHQARTINDFSNIHLTNSNMEINASFFQCQQFPLYGHGQTRMDNDLLPPLPGEEVLPPWSNSVDTTVLHNQNQIMNSDQQIIGGDVHNSENIGMFSGLNLEAIFRT